MQPEDVGNEAAARHPPGPIRESARLKKKDSKFLNLTNSLTFAFPKKLVD
jgi:hypothetical protein